jgi:hypothetical protein
MDAIKIKKIGKSMLLCGGKVVAGPTDNLRLVCMMVFSYITIYFIWIIFVSGFFGCFFSFFVSAFFSILIYNYLKCYLSDPGIIPRNHNLYSKIGEKVIMKSKIITKDTKDKLVSLKSSDDLNSDNENFSKQDSDYALDYMNLDNSLNKYDHSCSSNEISHIHETETETEVHNKKVVHMFSTTIDDPNLFGLPNDKSKINSSNCNRK